MSRRLPAAALLIALAVLAAATASVPAAAASHRPPAGVRADPPFLRDGEGRAVFFHGVNAVWKTAPYVPPSKLFGDPNSFFDRRDARFLAATGLNHVRLGVLFAGVMPEPGVIDEAYLDRVAAIVRMLGERGVSVLLDFHQDLYSEVFGGEGFPDWAVITDGVPATNCCGFPANYYTPGTSHAFDSLYLDRDGLIGRYAGAWAAVAARFVDAPNVTGYDLINEPWPGTQWPTCANEAGCPAFDSLVLQPFLERVIAAIRTVDAARPVYWEAQQWTGGGGFRNQVGLVHPIADPAGNAVLSFHDYCLATLGAPEPVLRATDVPCAVSEDQVFQGHGAAAERNHSALALTEFGASDDLVDVGRLADLADRYLVSWDYWSYGSWLDPTGSPSSQGMFADDLDRPGSLKLAKALLLIRTYPQAVAGTPTAFAFHPERDDRLFTLTYEADPAVDAPTVVFVPVRWHYPDGYAVEVSGPAAVVSAPDAAHLLLANTGAGTVTVTVRRP